MQWLLYAYSLVIYTYNAFYDLSASSQVIHIITYIYFYVYKEYIHYTMFQNIISIHIIQN